MLKSPEPMPICYGSYTVALHAASRQWLSFSPLYAFMKDTTLTLIIATIITIVGCGKKLAPTNHSTPTTAPTIVTNYSLVYTHSNELANMQIMVNQCQVIAYATPHENGAASIVFTISEIWKGTNEASLLGITNGTQFSVGSLTIPDRDALDGGIVLIPTVFYERGIRQVLSPSEAIQKRQILPVRAGQYDGMTVNEYKDRFGL